MSSTDTDSVLVQELLLLFEPVTRCAADPASVEKLLAGLGWNAEALFGPPPNPLIDAFTAVSAVAQDIQRFVEQPPRSFADMARVLACAARVVAALDALPSALTTAMIPERAALLAADLAQSLALVYLRRRAPAAVDVLRLLTLVTRRELATVLDNDRLLREPVVIEQLELARLPLLLGNPVETLRAYYLPSGLALPSDAQLAGSRIFPAVVPLLSWMGAVSATGLGSSVPLVDQDRNDDFLRSLTATWLFGDELNAAELGIAARLLSQAEQGPGLVLVPFGAGELVLPAGPWVVALSLGGSGGSLAITPNGIVGELSTVDLQAGARVVRATLPDRPMRIGDASGTRLELASVSVGAQGAFHHDGAGDVFDYGAHALVKGARLVIAAPDGDGFLSKFLPPDGVNFEFDLGLEWSKQHGLRLHGGGGVDSRLPVNRSLLGVLTLDSIRLALGFKVEPASIRGSAGLSFSLDIGPVHATVDDMGLAAQLLFPPSGGNLGVVDLALQFKPPNGIGLAIDATVVKGGGFIGLDFDKQQYSGVLQLAIQKTIDVKAIGLLNARLPGGKPGFSLLLIITAEFPPIQLGMGFTLNGIGGLAGINRTAAVDVLRAGLRNGALDTMLFPRDPMAHVPALLSTLGTVFPVAEGRYVFGPMVRIGWGSPAILTLDVAVLIELPDPVRIILLGRLKAALPDEKKPVAVIRMDALGVLDFGRKELSLDATIYDSKILTFTLSGDMALRLSWGDSPSFLLSVGGFHPHFQPPAAMPALARMALVLVDFEKDGVTARVRLDSYFAITSNTVQFGAHVQAYVKVLAVEVQGLLGFDALVHFPFAIDAQMVAAVTLSFNGVLLMGAEVSLNLTGPGPWHLVGEARFVFLGVQARAPIDFTSDGASAATAELPPPADVAAQLAAALTDARNWQPVLPQAQPRVARLAPAAAGAGELLIHPLAGLAVRQRVAPLGVLLARYGNAPIAGGLSRFQLHLNLANAATAPLREAFAMAQYQVLSDGDKLARPSFEDADAGLQVQVDDFGFAADAVLVVPAAVFEDRLIDPAAAPPAAPRAPLPRRGARALKRRPLPKTEAQKLQAYLDTRAAAALAPRTRSGKARYAPVPSTTPR